MFAVSTNDCVAPQPTVDNETAEVSVVAMLPEPIASAPGRMMAICSGLLMLAALVCIACILLLLPASPESGPIPLALGVFRISAPLPVATMAPAAAKRDNPPAEATANVAPVAPAASACEYSFAEAATVAAGDPQTRQRCSAEDAVFTMPITTSLRH